MSNATTKAFALLGEPMKDLVTGYAGMVDSISFDVYGCIQADLRPKVSKDGTIPTGYWFDLKRLVPDGKRIMPAPKFAELEAGSEPGPADKPARFDQRSQ